MGWGGGGGWVEKFKAVINITNTRLRLMKIRTTMNGSKVKFKCFAQRIICLC